MSERKIYETIKFTNFLLIAIVIILIIFLVSYIIIARKAETVVVETTNTFTNIFRPFAQFIQNVNNDIQTTTRPLIENILNNPQTNAIVNNAQNLVSEFEEDLSLIVSKIQEIFSRKENIKGKKHVIDAHMEQFNELLNEIEKKLSEKDDISKKTVQEYNVYFSTIYESLYQNTKSKYLKFLAIKNKY